MYCLFESIQMKHFFSLFPSILVLGNRLVYLKVSKSGKKFSESTNIQKTNKKQIKTKKKLPDSFQNIFFTMCRSFYGRIENFESCFRIY